MVQRALQDWHDRVRDFENRGLTLRAFDAADQGLVEYPDDPWLRHRAVLALARSGALELAQRHFLDYGLDAMEEEEVAALGARLIKDRAWRAHGPERTALAAQAAAAYGHIHQRTGGYFPGINAATLTLVAGDAAGAQELAGRILADLDATPPIAADAYYHHATRAEALLLLNREEEAKDALSAAAAAGNDMSAWATTRRQLRRICTLLAMDIGVLEPIKAAPVIHYSGHLITASGEGRFPAAEEQNATGHIAEVLDRLRPGYAYGALACGADILFAEALLARGAELNLVFPFAIDDFIEVSVRPAGDSWVDRFHQCLDRAANVELTSDGPYAGDDQLFAYASQQAMGMAVLRADHLDTAAQQIALWDGRATPHAAGTAADVALWREYGYPQTIIPCSGGSAPNAGKAPPATGSGLVNRAILFGDIKGFSKLNDQQVPKFVDHVLGTLAVAIEGHDKAVVFRNTWGDGIFLVFDDVVSAAQCALDMQGGMATLDMKTLGLPDFIGLRLGGHFGPVHPGRDPILKRANFFGVHVSRAARIEPITPPGAVYVTEHFAARLALLPGKAFSFEYVGDIPAAKDYGTLPMHLLRPREDN